MHYIRIYTYTDISIYMPPPIQHVGLLLGLVCATMARAHPPLLTPPQNYYVVIDALTFQLSGLRALTCCMPLAHGSMEALF